MLTDSSDDRPLSDFRRSSSSTANTSSTQNKTNVTRTALGISPTPPANFKASNGTTYQIRYNQTLTTRDQRTTHTLYGGQQACRNFQAVAAAAKNAGALLITVGYNLDSSMMCSEHNSGPSPSSSIDDVHYISNIAPTDGSWTNSQRDACRSGSGSSSSPYVLRTSTCREGVTVTYTSTITQTGNIVTTRGDDQSITDVLASAAGAKDVGPSSSNGCMNDTSRAEENSDGDFFFCSASGDDMGPIFQTALSQVGTGVKLLSGLPR